VRLRSITPSAEGIDERGLLVKQIEPSNFAARAGLQEGYIKVQVNHETVASIDSFHAAIEGSERFSAVTVVREGRQMLFFVLRALGPLKIYEPSDV
jgi:S1-C subfamily serine protease|tara:strand:- start:631 stop:918 length:288 start_codon:yes stop_codon:yes gene_type:complete